MDACECLNSSLFGALLPVPASEGIRDIRHVAGGAELDQLSCLFGELFGKLCGHPGGKSVLPSGQRLRWAMMEWLVVLSHCHRRRRRHCSSLSLLCLTSKPNRR